MQTNKKMHRKKFKIKINIKSILMILFAIALISTILFISRENLKNPGEIVGFLIFNKNVRASPPEPTGCVKICSSETGNNEDLKFIRCSPQRGGENICGAICFGVYNSEAGIREGQIPQQGASCDSVQCVCR